MATKTEDHLERFRVWVTWQESHADAGRRLGCTGQTVLNILHGSRPSLRVAVAIQEIIGIPPKAWADG